MNPNSIVYNNFLGVTFEELKGTLGDICFDSNESMTEFYDFCNDRGIRAIKIESNESPKSYHLQYFIDSEKTLENLKLLVSEISLIS
jgi:hypothetical protein